MSWLLLAAALALQAPNPFEGLKDGDRVQVVLKNKHSFTGVCFQIPKDKKQLTIKLHGYSDVDGTITFRQHTVLRVTPLLPLDPTTQEELLREVAEERDRTAKAEERRRAREKELADKRKQDEEKRKKEDEEKAEADKKHEAAVSFYTQFPESAGWGQEAYDSIKTKLQFTPEEKLFFDNFKLWQEGKAVVEGSSGEGSNP